MSAFNMVLNMRLVIIVFFVIKPGFCFPEQGKWKFRLTNKGQDWIGIAKSLSKDSAISIKIICDSNDKSQNAKLKIGYVVRQTQCWKEYMELESINETLRLFYICPNAATENFMYNVRYLKSGEIEVPCDHTIDLPETKEPFMSGRAKQPRNGSCDELFSATMNENSYFRGPPRSEDVPLPEGGEMDKSKEPTEGKLPESAAIIKTKRETGPKDDTKKVEPQEKPANEAEGKENSDRETPKEEKTGEVKPKAGDAKEGTSVGHTAEKSPTTSATKLPHGYQVKIDQEGVYLLVVMLKAVQPDGLFNATIEIEMKGPHGYLSAADWPLLPFFGTMCGLYVFYAISWLIVSALQWRDLLRIQFWIGGVIFLGMLEKAVFYAEYQSVNSTGSSVKGAILFAEVLSCLKKTMASMLIIIVSLGFGIVKPRLGPMLHRVVGVGMLYFLLGTVEACLRVYKPPSYAGKQVLMGLLPLAVLESGMCWWVFSSLVQTTRTLRLRRNVVKLTLYRHFTNALIFAVIASVVFMIWSFHSHNVATCLADWKELWVDIAYWHLLFGILLLVIMILWRPTNNNQRYAFTPLLDAADDEEEDAVYSNDAFDGMKMRSAENQGKTSPKDKERKQSMEEDDLRWVEENIPSSLAETALPSLMDSEEEILATKFERNKME